ncbi:MAG: precorrin-8X methylmutase [Dethiobacteria bacterium]
MNLRTFITDPAAIEEKSMQIIEAEMGGKAKSFNTPELAVVKRVIHTTADFEYADLLLFSPGALETGIEALKSGNMVLVSDTNMIVSGVNKGLLSSFGAQVVCLVADEETRSAAVTEGLTRSMVNIRRAVQKYPEAIFAIGNAPTALYELLRLVESGEARPSLVVGVPVGFVEAAESKNELLKSIVPYIAIRGRKGGSTVAVAIINAMLKLAGS